MNKLKGCGKQIGHCLNCGVGVLCQDCQKLQDSQQNKTLIHAINGVESKEICIRDKTTDISEQVETVGTSLNATIPVSDFKFHIKQVRDSFPDLLDFGISIGNLIREVEFKTKQKMQGKMKEIEVKEEQGMTFWKLKKDNAWNRNIVKLFDYLLKSLYEVKL